MKLSEFLGDTMFTRRRHLFVAALVVALAGVSVVDVVGASAQQGGPPILSSVSVTPASTSADLTSSVDPNGLDTTVMFDYGTTSAYGSSTPFGGDDIGSVTVPVPVSIAASGLTPATTYHYELIATNAAGSVNSGDLEFTTTSRNIPTTTTARPASKTTARLVDVRVATPSNGVLNAVACGSATMCLAVGNSGQGLASKPLVDRWTGSSWVATASPVSPGAALVSISCTSPRNCVAVGHRGSRTYGAHWNGSSWSVEATISPPTISVDLLYDVSCLSARSCWAVGQVNGATPSSAPLAEHWNGATWTVLATPHPFASFFNGVSCSSASNCWAVGESHDTALPFSPLAEHWNGHSWSAVVVPGKNSVLNAVSCAAPNRCWITGKTSSGNSDLVLRYLSGAWRNIPAPPADNFMSVVCLTAQDCWAAGSGYLPGTRGVFAPIGAHWNGLSWVAVTNGAKAGNGYFSGLACPTRTRCLAVGVNSVSRNGQTAIGDIIETS